MKLHRRLFEAVARRISRGASGSDISEMSQVFSDLWTQASFGGRVRLLFQESVGLLSLRREQVSHSKKRKPEMFTNIKSDLINAVRLLVRYPVYASVAIATLALGIGANTAIYTVVNGVLLEPLPYQNPDGIVSVGVRWQEPGRSTTDHGLSEPEALDFRGARSVSALGTYQFGSDNITGGDQPIRVPIAAVESSVFEILGVGPQLGRIYGEEEDLPGNRFVALLSSALWRDLYDSDPSVIGRSITLDGESYTIVGVMPPGFGLPEQLEGSMEAALWRPRGTDWANPDGRGSHFLYGLARVAPGSNVAAVGAEFRQISDRLTEEGLYTPEVNFHGIAEPVSQEIVGAVRLPLILLLGAVGFILLITCANIANLSLARSQARVREMSVRAAIGASRGRLISQMLAESTVLALVGGLAGLGVAATTLPAIKALGPGYLPRFENIQIDVPVLGFALLVSLLTGLTFGLLPALKASRPDLLDGLKAGGRGGNSVGSERLRKALMASQVAFAVLLVTGAGLTLRSFTKVTGIDTGFSTENLLTMQISLAASDYPEPESVSLFYRELVQRVRALPGVSTAAIGRVLPLQSGIGDWTIRIEGREAPPGADFDGDWQVVGPGYIEAMGIPVLEGRTIEDLDVASSQPVALINKEMVDQYWPDESPIGKRFTFGRRDAPPVTIVGVVGNVRHNGIKDAVNRKFYIPHEQWSLRSSPRRAMYLIVGSESDPAALTGAVRSVVRDLDPNLPIARVMTYDAIRAGAVAQERLIMSLLMAFGVLALVIASVGVYGVISYSVSQKVREIGVRIALGATRADVVRMVVLDGGAAAGAGVVVGVAGAALLATTLSSLLYGVDSHDPMTFAAVPLILLTVAGLASLIPARRAAGVQPVEALKSD